MSARLDTLADIPGLGTNINNARVLASCALRALGVNMRADNGAPTIQTIYSHGLTELCADLRRLAENLPEEREDISAAISRLHDRADLLNEGAAILAGIVAAEDRGAR